MTLPEAEASTKMPDGVHIEGLASCFFQAEAGAPCERLNGVVPVKRGLIYMQGV